VSELLHLQAKTDWLHSAGARIQERDGGVYAASTGKDQTFFGFCKLKKIEERGIHAASRFKFIAGVSAMTLRDRLCDQLSPPDG
jgi:hypothetical protein